MKVLFVNACVRGEGSRTLELCREYIDAHLQGEDILEVEISKFGLKPLDSQSLREREADIAKGDLSSSKYDLARDFADADEILIGASFWDCSFPSILKVYIEHICVNGITFGYAENGATKPLCRAKKLTYITTVGGYMAKSESLRLYLEELCAMLGIPEIKIYKAEGLDIYGSDVDKIMREAKERIR